MGSKRDNGVSAPSCAPFVVVAIVCGIVLLIAIVIGAYLIFSRLRAERETAEAPKAASNIPLKPKPHAIPFMGCLPEGDGGDAELNVLKNRIDEGSYATMTFDVVEGLKWPQGVERRQRSTWSSEDRNEVSRYEGLPISVVGYVHDAREEGPESPNCHEIRRELRDFHIWITGRPDEDRSSSIVVEMTPPVRAKHPGWRISSLKEVARDGTRVRISGWLMLDPEHPDQIGKTRGTIWEVHPVMNFEVERQGAWISLDDFP